MLYCQCLYIIITLNSAMSEQVIVKVRENKYNHQKLVKIPSDSDIEVGDYISIRKVDDKDGG